MSFGCLYSFSCQSYCDFTALIIISANNSVLLRLIINWQKYLTRITSVPWTKTMECIVVRIFLHTNCLILNPAMNRWLLPVLLSLLRRFLLQCFPPSMIPSTPATVSTGISITQNVVQVCFVLHLSRVLHFLLFHLYPVSELFLLYLVYQRILWKGKNRNVCCSSLEFCRFSCSFFLFVEGERERKKEKDRDKTKSKIHLKRNHVKGKEMHVSCSLSVYFFSFLVFWRLVIFLVSCLYNQWTETNRFWWTLVLFLNGCVLINSSLLPLGSRIPLHSLTSFVTKLFLLNDSFSLPLSFTCLSYKSIF